MFQGTQTPSGVRAHLRSNVIGYVALFLALTMGTAYASHPGGANTISSEDIIDGAVTRPKIANGAVIRDKINGGAVDTGKLANDAVTSAKVADGAVGTAQLQDLGVTTEKLAEKAVGNNQLAAGAVEAGQIKDLAVTGAKLADGAVTNSKLGLFAVSSTKILPRAVTSSKIADGSVTSSKIADGSVRAEDMSTDSIGGRALRPLVTRVANVTVFGGAAAPTVVTAACNVDEVVISGGADWEHTGYHTRIIESRRSGNGWRIEGYYGDGPSLGEDPDSIGLEAEAYCLRL